MARDYALHRVLAVHGLILGVVTLSFATSQLAGADTSLAAPKCSCAERVLYLDSQALEARKRHDLLGSSRLYEGAAGQRLSCLKSRTIGGHRADVMVEAADDYLDAGIDAHFSGNQSRAVRLLNKSVALANEVLLPDPTKSSVATFIIEAATPRLHGNWGPASLQYDSLPNWPKVKTCSA
jgi:hypothetical protein